jgi:hypothetical protein
MCVFSALVVKVFLLAEISRARLAISVIGYKSCNEALIWYMYGHGIDRRPQSELESLAESEIH